MPCLVVTSVHTAWQFLGQVIMAFGGDNDYDAHQQSTEGSIQ